MVFDELGERLSELAAWLANAMQPGCFNRDSRYWQSQRCDLVAKDEARFTDTDQQHVSLGE